MSIGLYTITTRATGTILTAAIYNADHQNHVTNQNPSMTGAYSDDEAQMQLQTSPGAPGAASLAQSLAGELERIRYMMAQIIGATYWYSAVPASLTSLSATPANNFGTGDGKFTLKNVADSGWVLCDDGTIGDASSGATSRANADTSALYDLLWNNIINTWCPVTGGRGATAGADFAAHKSIKLPLVLGRALAIAGAGAGLTSRVLGQNLGEENHQLSVAELANHGHSLNDPTHVHGGGVVTTLDGNVGPTNGLDGPGSPTGEGSGTFTLPNTAAAATGISIGTAGSNTPHNTMQPTSFWNIMVKL